MKKPRPEKKRGIVEQMIEVAAFLEKNNQGWFRTRTRKLPDVLPSLQALTALAEGVEETLKIWRFYKNFQLLKHFRKRLKKMPEVTMNEKKLCYGSIKELKYHQERGRKDSPK